ncbi:MAG: hypothetical protein BroJett003_01530 [Planctomycetota bacterium]|nr:MAG: hypothetical protein BroJett003_01530 [Planctomycetota bacterium]
MNTRPGNPRPDLPPSEPLETAPVERRIVLACGLVALFAASTILFVQLQLHVAPEVARRVGLLALCVAAVTLTKRCYAVGALTAFAGTLCIVGAWPIHPSIPLRAPHLIPLLSAAVGLGVAAACFARRRAACAPSLTYAAVLALLFVLLTLA